MGLTSVALVHAGDTTGVVDLGLRAGPGAVEVGLDNHVGGRGVKGTVVSWLEGGGGGGSNGLTGEGMLGEGGGSCC